jgi:hypothetical protein
MLGYVFGYSAHVYNSYYFSTRGIFYMFPGRQLAEEAEKIWHKKYHQPLPYVTGNWRLSGCVAIYGKDRPTFHGDYHGDYSGDYCNENLKGDRLRLSNWSTDQDVLKNGGLVFWNNGKDGESLPPPVQKRFPSAIVHPTAILLKQKIGKMKWSLVGVAVIPPDSSVKTQPFHPAPKRFYLPKK